MGEGSDEFSVEMHSGADDVLVVTLDGELELAEAKWVQEMLEAAAPHHKGMVIELGKLTFIDSEGIQALMMLRQRAQIHRLNLQFRDPSPVVERTLRSAGLMGLLDDS